MLALLVTAVPLVTALEMPALVALLMLSKVPLLIAVLFLEVVVSCAVV